MVVSPLERELLLILGIDEVAVSNPSIEDAHLEVFDLSIDEFLHPIPVDQMAGEDDDVGAMRKGM